MTRRIVRFLTASAAATLLLLTSARAEDTKGKWQFGFGISYFTTIDYIRDNSDLAFVTTNNDSGGLPGVGAVDERPDINILNQPSIQDDFKIDFSGSYGLTRWLALEIAGSYQKSSVGNIEYFVVDNTRQPLPDASATDVRACGSDALHQVLCDNYPPINEQPEKRSNSFVPVGQITKIPIQFSGLIRFRPESPFDPYVGLGVGYTLASLENSRQFNDRAQEVSTLKVNQAWEGEFTNLVSEANRRPALGQTSFTPGPLQATVRNSFEWHAVSGVDYYVNDHFSFYVDARYVWTAGQVNITADSAHQVLFAMVDEGQLLLRKQTSDPESADPTPTYLWEDKLGLWNPNPGHGGDILDCTVTMPPDDKHTSSWTQSCTGDGLYETEDKNQNGLIDHPTNGPSEDDGVLVVYPAGFIKYAQTDGQIANISAFCNACVGNEPDPGANGVLRPDTEDHNYNFYMDRFLLYGIDFCTTPESVGSSVCANSNSKYTPGMPTRYVWPEGCAQSPKLDKGEGTNPEGCPAPQASGAPVSLAGTASDNATDSTLIQGGRIRLGGFSLGFGFKFTF